MKCTLCGCSDFEPCYDPATGRTCGWAETSLIGPLCTFCEDIAYALAGPVDAPASDDEELDESPVVELFSEAQANQYLRARAGGGA